MKNFFYICYIIACGIFIATLISACSDDNTTNVNSPIFEKDKYCNETTDCWQPDTLWYYKLQCRLTDESCDYLNSVNVDTVINCTTPEYSECDLVERFNTAKNLYCPEVGIYREHIEFTDTVNIDIPSRSFRVKGTQTIPVQDLAAILYSVKGIDEKVPELVRLCKLKSKSYRINPELPINEKSNLNDEYTIEE